MDGNGLVQLTVDAHGGLERLRRFEHVSAHLPDGTAAPEPLIVTIALSDVEFT